LKRNILPYNPKLKELSKKLRRNMTYSEVKLWNELKNGKLNGYDFYRQKAIGNYIVETHPCPSEEGMLGTRPAFRRCST
jgi:very-short-patch-repair endonuclease